MRWAWSCGRGLIYCVWQRWVPSVGPGILGASDLGRSSCGAGWGAGVAGLLFRAPLSGPGNVRGAGIWGGVARTRAPFHPEYPVLARIT